MAIFSNAYIRDQPSKRPFAVTTNRRCIARVSGRQVLPAIALTAACLLTSGCGTTRGDGVLDKTLEVVGLKRPDPPELPKLDVSLIPRKVTLRIHAGDQLNTDISTRSLSIVIRVYKLKSSNSFLLAPYDAFKDADTERKALGAELIEVRELVLAPGQKHEVVETLLTDASTLGVVALFRAPAEGRWRFAFDGRAAEKSGVTLGVHGCALSVAAGEPINAPPEMLRLAGVRCR